MKWQRMNYQPVLPLGEGGTRITASKEHVQLSRKAAADGMVLLKNEKNALPLAAGEHVALLGKGTVDYVKGGGGSGDVNTDYVHCLADGMAMKAAEGKLGICEELVEFYRTYVNAQYHAGYSIGMMPEPELPSELIDLAAAYARTAIVTISRFSGEGWDRRIGENDDIRTEYRLWPGEDTQRDTYKAVFAPNDFYLTAAEQKVLQTAIERFDKVVVVMNVGGVVDTNWTFKEGVSAVLMSWQGGMEGGLATADVLCGDVNPSGHLVDTFAKQLTDYPSTEGFHDSADYVCYTDDIYVGYRYFYTIPGAAACVNYPFGFGLGYTEFTTTVSSVSCEEDTIRFDVCVKNVGAHAGREVVQLYYSAPQGLLQKANRELIAFAKTRELAAGEEQRLTLTICVADMKSYDDTGKICDASWVMEKGTYRFFVGNNVRDAVETEFAYELAENVVIETTGHKLSPSRLPERLRADGTKEPVQNAAAKPEPCKLTRQDSHSLEGWLPRVRAEKQYCAIWTLNEPKPQLSDVADGRMSMEEFLAALSVDEKIELLGGQFNRGVANTCGVGNNFDHGIPSVMTADGPAGLRITPNIGVTTTAWPVATLLACTWDMELVERIGMAVALEVKENNLGLWLAPGCNIHRSPLCGRNFEYFSEDPYLTGRAGIAIVKGAQSQGIGTTPKHFAANNKETNRKASDSVVSERALREIYLKQFEMIVKEAKPFMIMSSYNLINGEHASECRDLLTGILRDEWKFDGVVTTDWWTLAEHYVEVKAGNDLKMACGYPQRVKEAYEKGYITEEEIDLAAGRILNMILKFE